MYRAESGTGPRIADSSDQVALGHAGDLDPPDSDLVLIPLLSLIASSIIDSVDVQILSIPQFSLRATSTRSTNQGIGKILLHRQHSAFIRLILDHKNGRAEIGSCSFWYCYPRSDNCVRAMRRGHTEESEHVQRRTGYH